MERRQAAVPPGPFHVTPFFVAKAEGAVVEDVDGNRLLDFTSGIGVTNVGHAPAAVVDAIADQSGRFLHSSFNVAPYEGYVAVAERLNALVPSPGPNKTFLANSGSEAVENAIKFARAYTKRQAIVCFDHAYHGRTYMAMALTSKTRPYKYGFAPFNPEVYRAPFPDLYQVPGGPPTHCGGRLPCADGQRRCVCGEALHAFRELVEAQIGEDQVAAVIIEPQTGEGGFQPVPAPFLRALQDYCRQHGIVFILDEIQTGFGRTGTMVAAEHSGVEPDLTILAKGLAAGMPLSAVTGRADILDATPVGGAGGTYSGNPVACAAALAVLDEFAEGRILPHARRLGEILGERLQAFRERFSCVGDVRGLGPMKAMEIVADPNTRQPDKATTGRILQEVHRHGLLLMGAGTHGNVIRFLFPLVTTEAQLHEGLDLVEAALRSVTD